MLRLLLLPLLIILNACSEPAERSAASAIEPPLVPLADLFAPSAYVAPQVSPDGRWVSWIEPVDGITNLFVAPIDKLDERRQLTFKTEQGVRATDVSGVIMYHWSRDSRYIIYPHDYAGDENWDLWRVAVDGSGEENLTPSPEYSWSILGLSDKYPGRIAAMKQVFGQPAFTLYNLDIESGERSEVFASVGDILAVFPDEDFEPVVAVSMLDPATFAIQRRVDDGWETMETITTEDLGGLAASKYQKIPRVDSTGRYFYSYSSVGKNAAVLVRFDLETGERRVVAEDPRVDLGGVLYDGLTQKPLAYAANWDRVRWHAIDEAVADDLEAIAAAYPDGDFNLLGQSRDGRYWAVRFLFPDGPTRLYLYSAESKSLTELGVQSPSLLSMQLSRTRPTIMESSDGLPLISYYSLPVQSDPDDDGMPDRPLPTVLLIHGGPSDERAVYTFAPFMQWLNNRGYAVYYMNYRGSAGFGKAYALAANGEWGGKMHTDLLEQLDYLVEKGVADPDKVAILGGSYGGYATLVGMTMTPDRFACGVDLVGPSNLEIPMPHWSPDRMKVFLGGDPRTEEGRAFLRSISPVTHAHKTKGAVLIGQGANDSRVPQDQSDQIVKIMEDAGASVVYAVYDDEGHGFQRPANNMSFWAITEVFLGECLGGRYQPIGDALKGSSIQVPVGAERIPGLPEALEELEATR